MSVAHLPKWDVTPIEIALDLEPSQLTNRSSFQFSGPAEPRICLVAAFALTSQLKRIVTAVDRATPPRLPSGLRIGPAKTRAPTVSGIGIVVAPMLALLRLQRRFIRAIEPGLADAAMHRSLARSADMDIPSAQFVGEFIAAKTLPTFEPACAAANFIPLRLRGLGITVYCLGRQGAPQSILGHWAYSATTRGSVHLRSGP
jgi:hypothetical protein